MPPVAAATAPVAYVRFHGRNWKTWNIRGATRSWERFDWVYSEEELGEWVEPFTQLAERAENAYAFFNNNGRSSANGGFVAQAATNAVALRGLLAQAGVPVSGGPE